MTYRTSVARPCHDHGFRSRRRHRHRGHRAGRRLLHLDPHPVARCHRRRRHPAPDPGFRLPGIGEVLAIDGSFGPAPRPRSSASSPPTGSPRTVSPAPPRTARSTRCRTTTARRSTSPTPSSTTATATWAGGAVAAGTAKANALAPCGSWRRCGTPSVTSPSGSPAASAPPPATRRSAEPRTAGTSTATPSTSVQGRTRCAHRPAGPQPRLQRHPRPGLPGPRRPHPCGPGTEPLLVGLRLRHLTALRGPAGSGGLGQHVRPPEGPPVRVGVVPRPREVMAQGRRGPEARAARDRVHVSSVSSRRCASSTRWREQPAVGVLPVSSRKRRAKVRGDMCARPASWSTVAPASRWALHASVCPTVSPRRAGQRPLDVLRLPPSRCGGTTMRRAMALATAGPCSWRTRCRQASMPGGGAGRGDDGAVLDVEHVRRRRWASGSGGRAPRRTASGWCSGGRPAGPPRRGRTRRSRRSGRARRASTARRRASQGLLRVLPVHEVAPPPVRRRGRPPPGGPARGTC